MNLCCVFIDWQAAVNKSIKTYQESVKSNIVVRIDQERFLPAGMYDNFATFILFILHCDYIDKDRV